VYGRRHTDLTVDVQRILEGPMVMRSPSIAVSVTGQLPHGERGVSARAGSSGGVTLSHAAA